MTQGVPVASKLLDSKVMGVSARRLGESLVPPLLPCLVLYTVGTPLLVTLPALVVGAFIGIAIYQRTPSGQRPIAYTSAVLRYYRGHNTYIWKSPATTEDELAHRTPQDVWLTRDESETTESELYWPAPVEETEIEVEC